MTKETETNDYDENRRIVCELYGKDPRTASVHHIVFKHDVKDRRHNDFKGVINENSINRKANLYPFSDQDFDQACEDHTTVHDHHAIHQYIDEATPQTKVIYQRNKKKGRR